MNDIKGIEALFRAFVGGMDGPQVTCINCGKPSKVFLCADCEEAG